MSIEFPIPPDSGSNSLWAQYRHWVQSALHGGRRSAEAALSEMLSEVTDGKLRVRILNDWAVLIAQTGDLTRAQSALEEAVLLEPGWKVPRENLERLLKMQGATGRRADRPSKSRTRIAIVSLLFNWPSTGGGTVHTAELARFMFRDGYDVKHFVICYQPWSIGQITDPVDWPIERLEFDESQWDCEGIQSVVRRAVDGFTPDFVIITDSWNFKPRLAEALRGYRYFLRLAAQECLCPLNNVRLLWDSAGSRACPQNQLATPAACISCVRERAHWSGSLHQAERLLAGYDQPNYGPCLQRAFAEATGVLVVNPLIAEQVKPFTPAVYVIPSGFDPDRFSVTISPQSPSGPVRLLFAGLVDESMKGFNVLHTACRDLWSRRKDFRLIATADPPGAVDEFTEFIGWKTQADLPAAIQAADIVICPTIAEEALGRTAVEAMAAARPVVASRIGGLPFTVLDEATGLLCEPADPSDLQRQLVRLLDAPELRQQLGQAGRKRFLEHYTWNSILNRHYRKLLGAPVRNQ